MADVFVSYARADRALVAPLVAAIEAEGLSIWWDPAISPGQEFDRLISAEMEAAKAVIVVWTPSSVESRWVRGEAREAADRGILVPVRFNNARLPLDVRTIHTTDLDDWREDQSSVPFQELLRALHTLLKSPQDAKSTTASSETPRVRMTTIVSLDVAGYSKRTEDDQAASARQIGALRNRLGAIASRHGGRIFNTAGDSIMLEFSAAKEAVAAVFELLDDRPLSEPETRVGAHLGDVTVASSGDLLGHGVNVAARLMAQAMPGHALISGELRGALGHQIDRPMRDMGELQLAKMDTRIHAFEIAPKSAANPALRRQQAKFKRWQIGAACIATLAALGLALMVVQAPLRHKPVSGATAQTPAAVTESASLVPSKPRIAILPFENLSPDPNNAFFTDGMHEEILTALANSSADLDVISRTTMDSYKGKPVTVEQLVKDLGCSHVLEGSVRREGNEVRLTLQLIDARDDSHVWAQDYDRKLTSAMALQSEVANEVASQLSVRLSRGAETSTPLTTDPLAYDLYLRARVAEQDANATSPVETWRGVETLLSQAIKIDPQFAKAYLERFAVHQSMISFGYDVSTASSLAARADLDAARKLIPDDPAVLVAEAKVEPNRDRALALYQSAEAAGLSDPDVLSAHARLLQELGKWDEALALYERAAALDPANPFVRTQWYFAAFFAHRPSETLRATDLAAGGEGSRDLALWEHVIATFMFTGNFAPVEEYYGSAPPAGQNVYSRESAYHSRYEFLRFARKFDELQKWAKTISSESIRIVGFSWGMSVPGLSRGPTAEYRGWAALLAGDNAAAQREGGALLAYVSQQAAAGDHSAYMSIYAGVGHLLAGDESGAVDAAHAAITSASAADNAFVVLAINYKAAQILARTKAADEATTILESLAASTPGLPPAAIARDPAFDIPLAGNARYQAFKAKLEAQMAENAKLLNAASP